VPVLPAVLCLFPKAAFAPVPRALTTELNIYITVAVIKQLIIKVMNKLLNEKLFPSITFCQAVSISLKNIGFCQAVSFL
jgi:hypothetical protein